MSGEFDGRIALVTGAGHGIGRAIATRLAAGAASLVLVGHTEGQLEETARLLRDQGSRAVAIAADLASRDEIQKTARRAREAFGRIDVLVNNAAAHGERRPLLETTAEDWEKVVRVNLTGTFLLSQAVARTMAECGGGAIVNVLAIQSEAPVPTWGAYASSKGGLVSLTRALAVELAPLGIRVNGVQPGPIDTDTTRAVLGAQGTAAAPAATLLGRAGRPEEVAEVIAFLASERASFMTGSFVRVDGGRLLSRKPDPYLGGARDLAR